MAEKHWRLGNQSSFIWAIAAVVLIGAFLAWLALVSEPTGVAVREAPAEDEETQFTVNAADFGMNPLAHAGEDVRLAAVTVVSRLGDQAFWVELPTQPHPVPYLIRLDTAVARLFAVQSGQSYNVTGRVYPMSDSVLTAWQEQGVLTDDMQRMEAEFASTFLEAHRLLPAAAPGT